MNKSLDLSTWSSSASSRDLAGPGGLGSLALSKLLQRLEGFGYIPRILYDFGALTNHIRRSQAVNRDPLRHVNLDKHLKRWSGTWR